MGDQMRQVKKIGKRRSHQQAGQQIAGDPGNAAERCQPATDQGTNQNHCESNDYLKKIVIHVCLSLGIKTIKKLRESLMYMNFENSGKKRERRWRLSLGCYG